MTSKIGVKTRRGGAESAGVSGVDQFGPHAPSILTVQNLIDLKSKHGVPAKIELVLPDPSQSPELVRPGFCCAYLPYFVSSGLTFPLPSFLFDVLGYLEISFPQMLPNFVRHVVGLSVLAREEGICLTVPDFLRICDVKPNSSTRGTYYISPRPSLGILDGATARDDKWKEKYFFFKIDSFSVGDHACVPTNWGLGRGLKTKKDPIDDRLQERILAAYDLPIGERHIEHVSVARQTASFGSAASSSAVKKMSKRISYRRLGSKEQG